MKLYSQCQPTSSEVSRAHVSMSLEGEVLPYLSKGLKQIFWICQLVPTCFKKKSELSINIGNVIFIFL